MALKVWLPLNKDIKNFGLDNSPAFTNNGATLTTGGVFNKCYSFNGSSNYIAANELTIDCSHISACAWVYANNSQLATGYIISLNNGGGYVDHAIALSYESTSKICFAAGGVSSLKTSGIIGSWVHLAVTFDGQKIIGYVNGSKIGEVASTSVLTKSKLTIGARTDGGTGFTYFFNGKINDVRIYDHTLSEEDVKRIYQQKMFELVPYSGVKDVLFDRSGFGLMPLVNNGADFQTNCLYFDGTNDQLRPKVTNDGFNISGGTLSIWFTPTEKPDKNRLVYADEKSHMSIGFSSTGNSLVVRCGTSNGYTNALSTTGISWGSLNNVIVTYNNTMPQICLINGIVPSVYTTTTGFSETAGVGLTIGGRQCNTTSRFDGKIYKVAVYNKQLTQDEAVELYNSERGMFLPDDYIQLEYIQSTGTQWIDTGIKGHMNYTYELEFQQTDTGNYRNWGVFGQSSYVGPNMSLTYASGFALRWENLNNSTNMINSISSVDTNKHFVRIVNGELYWDGVDKGKSPGHKNDFVINYNLFLCTVNPGGTTPSANAKSKYYLYKVYDENGVLIQNLIPAKRKSDNVIGMYDLVSRQFFTNAGSGSFTGA